MVGIRETAGVIIADFRKKSLSRFGGTLTTARTGLRYTRHTFDCSPARSMGSGQVPFS